MNILDFFSKKELSDIFIAVVVITLIFSFEPFPNFGIVVASIPFYFLAVIVTFVFHELAHRFVARRFNCVAFFKLWPHGVLLGLILMFFGIKFVAPGAVVIYPFRFGRWGFHYRRLTQTEIGLIALAGVLVNLFLAITFSLFSGPWATALYRINIWLFLFNMLPIPPLDGSKIMWWKPWVWVFLFILGIVAFLPVV